MSGEIDITPGYVFDEANNEIVTLTKLNQLVADMIARLQAGGVTARELADGSITSDKLDAAIAAQLGIPDGSITTAKIVDLAVTAAKLAADAVETAKIKDAAVTAAKIADGVITAAKLAGGAGLLPTGSILTFAGSTAPTGFLECAGAAVSRVTYADLFTAIGITHGQGNGSTTFNLPDYRGRFLRGYAHGSTLDPDRASRTAMATGGATGDNVGSVQAEAFKTHTHTVDQSGTDSGISVRFESTAAASDGTLTTNATGGNETRPVNAYVMYCIKT